MDYHIKLRIWEQLFQILKTFSEVRVGSEARLRMFIEAIEFITTTGCQWRRLPATYGCWRAIHRRFKRWSDQGVWQKLFQEVQVAPDLQQLMIDTTIVRAHACATGYKKNTQSEQSLGRSCGGLSTKIHALVDGLGYPLKFILTPGQEHDSLQGAALLEGSGGPETAVLADRGYDVDALIEEIEAKKMTAVIPPKKNRIIQREYDREVYKERHLVENFFSRIKQFRRIFSRFEKLASVFLSCLHFVSALIWLG